MPNISGMMHLKIMKGIAKTPGDTQTSETGLDEVNLLDIKGFSCDEYLMRLPSLKSSAVYADNSLTDGRTLISGSLDNVKEVIRLTLNAPTIIELAAMLSKLGRMKQDCNDFWDAFGQVEPVYLKHQVVGEPGPRYALLYDIEIDIESPINPSDPSRTVTLNIEREFGWRGIAPGDNPKRWAIENVFTGQKFSASNASLFSGNDFLFIENNILNRAEQNSTQTSYNTKNFVDIPAASIPGDLPALMCLVYSSTTNAVSTALMIAKSSKRNTGNISRQTGLNQYIVRIFNAADATVGTDTTLAADTGASTGTTGLQRRSQTTFGTATMAVRLTFQTRNIAVQHGKYAVFLRARLSASSTTVNLQLVIDEVGADINLTPVPFTNEGSTGTGNTTNWGLAYLGQVTVPNGNRKTQVSSNGMGLEVNASSSAQSSAFQLWASRTAGAGVLYVNDLILMPIDEGMINVVTSNAQAITADAVPGAGVIYDNTGYLQHGSTDDIAIVASAASTNYSEYDRLIMSGSPMYLTPGVDNRLEFLNYVDATKFSRIANPAAMTVRVSIVPRWAGYRTQ